MGNTGQINLDGIQKTFSSAASLDLYQGTVTPQALGAHTTKPCRGKTKTTMTPQKLLINHSSSLLRRGWVLTLLAVGSFAFCQQLQSATDTPDPGGTLPVSNTADGLNALKSITTGIHNAAFGFDALLSNSDANFNTAIGSATLLLNDGAQNTAVGTGALLSNTIGSPNTAVGTFAMFFNVDGAANTAVGDEALEFNVSAVTNAAVGQFALQNNDSSGNGTAAFNTAVGGFALQANVDGTRNTAVGAGAMESGNGGNDNTAVGEVALLNIAGSNNVAVGSGAGNGLGTSVNNCIAIGAPGAGPFATFSNTCFIGSIFGEPVSDPGTQTAVFVDQFNVVGIFNSSRKYKHDIQPMDKASEELYRLKPVTFKFNSDWKGTKQYGLIAEEVAEVDPQLVVHKDGELVTVRYEQVNSMLLNEFLKEHQKVQALENTVAQQQKGMEVLTAQLKEQAAQIQKVSAQAEMAKPATKVVVGNQ